MDGQPLPAERRTWSSHRRDGDLEITHRVDCRPVEPRKDVILIERKYLPTTYSNDVDEIQVDPSMERLQGRCGITWFEATSLCGILLETDVSFLVTIYNPPVSLESVSKPLEMRSIMPIRK